MVSLHLELTQKQSYNVFRCIKMQIKIMSHISVNLLLITCISLYNSGTG